MGQDQNFHTIERDYARSEKRPWFALIFGAQVALMLAFLIFGIEAGL